MAFQMRMIPTEAREIMMVNRDGLSLEDFLEAQWKRRAKEYPEFGKSSSGWPATCFRDGAYVLPRHNITPMRKQRL